MKKENIKEYMEKLELELLPILYHNRSCRDPPLFQSLSYNLVQRINPQARAVSAQDERKARHGLCTNTSQMWLWAACMAEFVTPSRCYYGGMASLTHLYN